MATGTGHGKSVRKSLVWSFAQRYTSLPLNILTVTILSRLLTPEEIGVFSVAAGLAALVIVLRSFGVSDFLVQARALDDGMIRTSFTVNLLTAWALALLLFSSSWLVGGFYGDPGVGRVMRVLSGTFLLVPFGTTAMALLKRDMAFGVLYRINTGASLARSGMTIGLAFAGFSYMSMAWGSLAEMVALVLGCTVWGHRYRARGLGLSEWRRMVPFGMNRTVADIVGQLGEQSANIIVGKMLGLSAAGFYSRGYSIVNIFRTKVVAAITAVAYPAFAAAHRESGAAPALFLRALVYLTGIAWPFFTFAALMAFPLIRILFGDQWDAAVPIMRWLCAAAIVATLIYQCNQFLVAVGRAGTVTRVEVRYQLAAFAAAFLAAFHGVEAVAAAQVLVYAVAAVLYYRTMRRHAELTLRRCARALLPSVAVTVMAAIVPAVVLAWPGLLQRHLLVAFLAAAAGSAAGWLAGAALVKHPLLGEMRRLSARLRGRLGMLQHSSAG